MMNRLNTILHRHTAPPQNTTPAARGRALAAAPQESTEAQRQADARARRTQAAGARNRVLLNGTARPQDPEAALRARERAQQHQAIVQQWQTWANDPNVSEQQRACRQTAVQRVANAQSDYALDLSTLNLEGTLPPVPRPREGIVRVNGNPGLTGFTSLPPGLSFLDAGNCGLEQLPQLPETLKNLHVSGNTRLGTLPRLPPSLESLSVANCGLQRLEPFPQGSRLKSLNVSGNPLGSFPRLPEHLNTLTAKGCGFTALPAITSSSFLRHADFSNNQIVDISERRLPDNIYRLNLNANPLRLDALPHWMMGLGMECETHGRRETEVRISLGHLPNAEQLRQRMGEQLHRSNGPRVYFDMTDHSRPTPASPAP